METYSYPDSHVRKQSDQSLELQVADLFSKVAQAETTADVTKNIFKIAPKVLNFSPKVAQAEATAGFTLN